MEGWGTFFSGLFSLWSQDLKETHRTTKFKAVRDRGGGLLGDKRHVIPKPKAPLLFFLLEYTYPPPWPKPVSEVRQSFSGLENMFVKILTCC